MLIFADNISDVKEEKRACHAKCTLSTHCQEATKIDGTTLTTDLSTPLGIDCPPRRTTPLNSPQCHWHPSASPVGRPTCSFKLVHHQLLLCRTSHNRVSTISYTDPFLAPRPINVHSPRRSARLLCSMIFRTRLRSTLRTLEFWMSVLTTFVNLNRCSRKQMTRVPCATLTALW